MRNIIRKILNPFLQKAFLFWLRKPRKYCYKKLCVIVEPGVFSPFLTFSTKLLLEFIETLPLRDKTFLELGCGCGIISISAAKQGARVTASDINKTALSALSRNAEDHNVSIDIAESDLFENLQRKEFDFIIVNPPYYPKNPNTIAEHAWFCGENFSYFEKLFTALPDFLRAGSTTYMILSEDCDIKAIEAIANRNKLVFEVIQERKVKAERNYIFVLRFN